MSWPHDYIPEPGERYYPPFKQSAEQDKKDIRQFEKRNQAEAKKRRAREHPMVLKKEK